MKDFCLGFIPKSMQLPIHKSFDFSITDVAMPKQAKLFFIYKQRIQIYKNLYT